MLNVLILLAVVGILTLAAYVRLAPSDPALWHTDPAVAEPADGHFVVKPDGGDTDGPLLPLSPQEALTQLDTIIRATPRTTSLAGSPEEGRTTYVTRSRLWGFPDYTTVAATQTEAGTRFLIHARLRFGGSDMGVNAARVRAWLDLISP